MHDAESPSWSDASETRLRKKKNIKWRPPHEDEWNQMGVYVFFLENGKNCTSAALHAYVLRIYSDDAELASEFGVGLLLCCGINARNQVEKTRLSSEKRDIKMWVSGHTWNQDWWVAGRQRSGQKSDEMKKNPIFCVCVLSESHPNAMPRVQFSGHWDGHNTEYRAETRIFDMCA